MKIAIVQAYDADLRRQWPARPPAEFADIEFQFGIAEGADHVIALNGVAARTIVDVDPERVWLLIQEPPVPETRNIYRAQHAFRRIYAPDQVHPDPRWRTYWGALNWWVGKSYDELTAVPYPIKTTDLSFITSNETLLEGHRKRLAFLDGLKASGIPFELWGRGFRPLPDKWDVLSRSRYAVAFENYRGSDYWTEKLADCFLSYCTPFYYGASRIDRYFPQGSYLPIDLDDPYAFERIRDAIASHFHERNLSALEEARQLCLTKYNTLFFIAREVNAFGAYPAARRRTTLKKLRPRPQKFPGNVTSAIVSLIRVVVPRRVKDRIRHWRNQAGR
ncbi:MAG TPA: glycosyltransferase family 10 [Devosia sp.]|nr:glycosyltransferase family 10 [Devosia sp.]